MGLVSERKRERVKKNKKKRRTRKEGGGKEGASQQTQRPRGDLGPESGRRVATLSPPR